MSKAILLATTAMLFAGAPALAQTTSGAAATTNPTPPSPTAQSGAVTPTADDTQSYGQEIIVTATRRASPLSDVPLAVSAVTADALQNSGASDIRQLNQLAPSLLVSSTSSEAGAGGARIRGIGTVGDNAGLESSVATFIDGVYRSRAGAALTELGPVDRVEVLRGPQGTLFGRNASAGLINVVTARPKFDTEGYAEGSYGNYDYYRIGAGITGPLANGIAYRLDGVYTKRDGFLKDVISGRDLNNRDRYLVRGKLLFEPTDKLSVLLIGDYANRNEECCGAVFLPTGDTTRNAAGQLVTTPSSIAALERSIRSGVPGAGNGVIIQDPYARTMSITPGRSYRSDVKDWGGSAEITYDAGFATLTSISAYRRYKYTSGQDSDFTNLDILARPDNGARFNRFSTYSQETRLQGSLFNDRVDWLVGGYYAHENLISTDNILYGADYNAFASARVAAASPALAAFPLVGGFAGLNTFAQAFVNGQLPAATPAATRAATIAAIAGQVQNVNLNGTGVGDVFDQTSKNYALFTHNIVKITDRLSLTLGVRHTWENKSLDAYLRSTSPCSTYTANITRLRALAASNASLAPLALGLANSVLAPFAGLACVANSVNGDFSSKKKESEWSGTATLGYKATDRLLTYATYSRGYKAGGFNLDRAPLFNQATLTNATNLDVLKFQPEKVDAFEVGAKFDGRRFDINVAAFYQMFKSFQLNTFNGTNFFVTDVRGCSADLGLTDQDLVSGNSVCGDPKKYGVLSKGIEVEAQMYPARDITLTVGGTLASTRYEDDLFGTPDFTGNNSLQPALFLLPGARLSNSSKYVITSSASWTPPIGDGLKGLLYADYRYQSEINTGSDLFIEKIQQGVMVVNARIGIQSANGSWSVEAWSQNLTNAKYKQVAFNATLQGSNTSAAQTLYYGTPGTQLFAAFLAEPRTYGVTVRTKF